MMLVEIHFILPRAPLHRMQLMLGLHLYPNSLVVFFLLLKTLDLLIELYKLMLQSIENLQLLKVK